MITRVLITALAMFAMLLQGCAAAARSCQCSCGPACKCGSVCNCEVGE